MVKVILVIFVFEVCLLLTIIIKIYFYYYSGVFCLSKIDFDQNDLDHFDHFDPCTSLEKVEWILA